MTGSSKENPTGGKLLLIGWDAADWEMIDPLIARNQMPALARLIAGGVRGNLATLQPALSPMLWTSIATGKRADKHGICGFTEPLPDASGIGPVRSTSRKCKALWNVFSQAGRKTNVIGWFASHPAEPINGVILSDNFLRSGPKGGTCECLSPGTVHPPELAATAAEWRVRADSLTAEDLVPFIPRLGEIDLDKDDRPLKLARRLARAASVQAAATALIQTQPWDLMCVYYDAIDQFAHEFMPYHPPRLDGVTERDFDLYQTVMAGCYRFHDMMLHALLQYVDANTTVVLVSDHGYECGHRRPAPGAGKADPESCHRPFGVVCLKGPNVKRGERLYGASVLDVAPTILALAGLPVGGDMDGRPWVEAFERPVRPERIFSWEGVGDDKAGLHTAKDRQDPAEAAAAIQQLVDLGYIAAPGEDAQKNVRDTIRCNKTHLVRALLGTPRVREAVPLLKELCAEAPKEAWYPLTLARCQIGLRQLSEARALLEGCAPATRALPEVQLLFAELAFAEGNAALALSHVEAARHAGADRPLICNQVGRGYLQLRRWDDAAAAFRKSLETDPDNPAAFDGLARVHLEQGEPAQAVEKALLAVGLIHHFPEAHFHLATALEQCGKPEEAIAAYETALGMGYQPQLTHSRLAVLYRPIDARKADLHQRAAQPKKRRIYRADIKSNVPQ
ncbi:MAG TPA: alkaline phosphatase family protein [Candidatus Acidoferrum sp.]|nr:alkaline phosphatase family protein [Candidatus Acidoferrum sp.]